MISNGGTKPGSAVSEWVELGPRAPNVDLTSMSLGDVNAYVLTAFRKMRVSQALASPRLCIGIGALEASQDFREHRARDQIQGIA